MKDLISILTCVLLLLVIVSISGCTSSNVDPQTDIVIVGGNQINGHWNDQYHTEWFFNGNVKSKSGTKYDPVVLCFTAYDASGNVVGSQNITIDMTKGSGYFQVELPVSSEPTRVNMTIISATKI